MEHAHFGMLGMDRSSRRYSRCGGSSPWRAFLRPPGAHIFCILLPAIPVNHYASAFFGQPVGGCLTSQLQLMRQISEHRARLRWSSRLVRRAEDRLRTRAVNLKSQPN